MRKDLRRWRGEDEELFKLGIRYFRGVFSLGGGLLGFDLLGCC